MYFSKYLIPSIVAASMATFSAGVAIAESHTTTVEKTGDVPADVEFENGKVVFRAIQRRSRLATRAIRNFASLAILRTAVAGSGQA